MASLYLGRKPSDRMWQALGILARDTQKTCSAKEGLNLGEALAVCVDVYRPVYHSRLVRGLLET
jgi:hypothetical protein